MADINPILAAASRASSTVDNTTAGIVSARGTQQKLLETNSALQLDIGTNNALIESVKAQGDLAAQNARLNIGAAFGADMNQPGEVITQAATDMRAAYERKKQISQQLAENDSVSFMENPLQHILNSFAHNDLVTQYYSADRQEQDASAYIQEVNKTVSDSVKNQESFKVGLNQAAIDAAAKNTLDGAKILANTAAIQGLAYNIEGIKAVQEASLEQLRIKSAVFSAQEGHERLGIEMARFNEWKDQLAASKESDAFLIEAAQKGYIAMYGPDKAPNLSASPKAARQFLTLLRTPGEAGAAARTAVGFGQAGIFAGTPAAMIDTIKSGVNINFPESQILVQKLFEKSISDVRNLPQDQQPKNKEESAALLNKVVYANLQNYAKNPGKDADNPLTIGGVQDLIKDPKVASQPFTQKVIAPALQAGADMNKPEVLWSTGIAAIRSGKISLDEFVSGTEALYLTGVHTNLAVKAFQKYGIAPTKEMERYPVDIKVSPSPLFSTTTVDLTDRNSIKRAVGYGLRADMINIFGFGEPATEPELRKPGFYFDERGKLR